MAALPPKPLSYVPPAFTSTPCLPLHSGRRVDCLVANAAVYLPTAKEPTYTADGFELSVG